MSTSHIYVEQANSQDLLLKVTNLTKKYSSFTLDNVSFEIPSGVIVGFVGQNGAGKSTTLKCIMRTTLPDSGNVVVFGRQMEQNERECKQHIAFSTGTFEYYRMDTLQKICQVYQTFYDNWQQSTFEYYCEKFKLILTKKVKELSAGMKIKFALALALSHDAKLFVFDEPTSGLDPIARDELLDIFRDIVNDGDKSILFSTHITSDLDKCADYVLFIADGKILLHEEKDKLLEEHLLIKGGLDDMPSNLENCAVAVKTHSFGFTALITKNNMPSVEKFVVEKPTLEDIMVYYNLEGTKC